MKSRTSLARTSVTEDGDFLLPQKMGWLNVMINAYVFFMLNVAFVVFMKRAFSKSRNLQSAPSFQGFFPS